MGNKLYVGNLPFTITESELESFFSKAGTVNSTKIIFDRFSGKSRGFGFVEMSSDEEAQKAISELNGSEFEGRNLVVNEAREDNQKRRNPRP